MINDFNFRYMRNNPNDSTNLLSLATSVDAYPMSILSIVNTV